MEVKMEPLDHRIGLESAQCLSNNQLVEGFSFPVSCQSLAYPGPELETSSVGVVPSLTTLHSEDARKNTHPMYKNAYKHATAALHDELHQPHKVLKLCSPGLSPTRNGSLSMHPHIHMQQRHLHEQHSSHQQLLRHHYHQLPQQHLHEVQQAYQPQFHQASHQLNPSSIYMNREKGQCGHNSTPSQAPIMHFDSRSYGANFQPASCISFGVSVEPATREKPLLSCTSVADGRCIADLSPLLNKVNCEGHAAAPSKTPDHVKDHILAERKRREKLSERFVALSAMLPGLKKMDKATILADAIKFVKQLQEKLESLEEQATKTRLITVVKPSSKSESPNVKVDECQQRDIEIRIVGKSVLVRLHCEKIKGVLVRTVAELENLHLVVVNASILSFSDKAFDLTFSAQMEEGYEVTTELIIRGLEDVKKNP